MRCRSDCGRMTRGATTKSALLGALASVTLFAFGSGDAASLTVSILDVQGRPIPDAVLIATPDLSLIHI